MYLQQHRYGNRLTFVSGSVLLKVCRHLTFDSMHNNYMISTCVHARPPKVFTGCLSNSAFSKKLRSSRIRLCWLPFRRTSTNSYSAKWRRGLCGPPTLRVSLCRGHTHWDSRASVLCGGYERLELTTEWHSQLCQLWHSCAVKLFS